jgi:PleD family two-component response regulator
MDFLARDANGRFVVILPGSSAPEAAQVAKRVQTTQSCQNVQIGTMTIPVYVSLGLASYRPGDDADSLCRRAEKALGQGNIDAAQELEPLAH